MSRNATKTESVPRYYSGRGVTLAIIRRYAGKVVEQFQPDKIILFGSHAYGTPHDDSDVDLLVVMEARNQLDQGFKIISNVMPTFPLDLIVWTPKKLQLRLQEGESFLTEIHAKGMILYEKHNPRVGGKSRRRSSDVISGVGT